MSFKGGPATGRQASVFELFEVIRVELLKARGADPMAEAHVVILPKKDLKAAKTAIGIADLFAGRTDR